MIPFESFGPDLGYSGKCVPTTQHYSLSLSVNMYPVNPENGCQLSLFIVVLKTHVFSVKNKNLVLT